MSVFSSQFDRARPFSAAFAGQAGDRRFRPASAVTSGAIAGAAAATGVVAGQAAVEAIGGDDGVGADVVDGLFEGDLGEVGFDPEALDDAMLELPGWVVEAPLAGAVDLGPAWAGVPLDGGELGGGVIDDGISGFHTSSSIGGIDIGPEEAALLDDGGGAWSHHTEAFDTTVGGDGGDFSYVMTDDGAVTFGSDGGAVYS
ncbi:MAG: hypothetical protein AAFZ07_03415 [Actinomycetota bacterium]